VIAKVVTGASTIACLLAAFPPSSRAASTAEFLTHCEATPEPCKAKVLAYVKFLVDGGFLDRCIMLRQSSSDGCGTIPNMMKRTGSIASTMPSLRSNSALDICALQALRHASRGWHASRLHPPLGRLVFCTKILGFARRNAGWCFGRVCPYTQCKTCDLARRTNSGIFPPFLWFMCAHCSP